MGVHAFIELGVLLSLLVMCSVSLNASSYYLHAIEECKIADAISKAFGIPSLILVGLIMVRLVVLMLVPWTICRGQIVKSALVVSALLWTIGTAVHVFIVVLVQVKFKVIYIEAGLGLAIAMVPLHIVSCILGKEAVNRLL